MNTKYHAVIMAGGIGSRFWPLSRNQRPKQFLDILGTGHTLIQMTYDRLSQFIPKENIWVVSHVDYFDLIKVQLPGIDNSNILLEPMRKNTAPCLMYAASAISKRNPDALMFVAPSDHLIVNEALFISDVLSAFSFIENQEKHLLTFGIQASRPDTGYGYIHFSPDNSLQSEIYPVNQFVEKPDHNTALVYLQSGNFVWNSGMFLWSCKTFLSEMSNHSNILYQQFEHFDLNSNVLAIYNQCDSISIDYALMEKTDKAVVKTVDFGWSDLGTWGSLYQLKSHDDSQNSINGTLIHIDETSNCIIENSGKQLIAIQGLEDFIVVNTEDVLLICQKSSEQKIKDLVKKIEQLSSNKFT
jgi:mannose-1-phosphate guanylyltransferase